MIPVDKTSLRFPYGIFVGTVADGWVQLYYNDVNASYRVAVRGGNGPKTSAVELSPDIRNLHHIFDSRSNGKC